VVAGVVVVLPAAVVVVVVVAVVVVVVRSPPTPWAVTMTWRCRVSGRTGVEGDRCAGAGQASAQSLTHGCVPVFTPLVQCCYTVVILLLHCCYTVVTLL
jgi:hypothetical protein